MPRPAETAAKSPALSLGIVVPVLNEAAILDRALARLQQWAGAFPGVVVDGGSTEGSAGGAENSPSCPEG